MNRIVPTHVPATTDPFQQPGKRLRTETDNMLRDMAFVLQLTRRVKEQILDEHEVVIDV